MNTNEPKLKKFVEKWNKRNADIEKRRKKNKVIIKYSYEKKVNKLKEAKS